MDFGLGVEFIWADLPFRVVGLEMSFGAMRIRAINFTDGNFVWGFDLDVLNHAALEGHLKPI